MKNISVSDIVGEWKDPDFESGLIERCKNAWKKPISDLTNEEMATYLRQDIAVKEILPLARERVSKGYDDDTEMFDGELKEIVEKLKSN